MNIPEKVRIGGHEIEVTFEKSMARDMDTMGTSCFNALQIRIDETLPQTAKESVFLHEIIHIIDRMNNIELSEKQVIQLESGLYQVIQDNKIF